MSICGTDPFPLELLAGVYAREESDRNEKAVDAATLGAIFIRRDGNMREPRCRDKVILLGEVKPSDGPARATKTLGCQ